MSENKIGLLAIVILGASWIGFAYYGNQEAKRLANCPAPLVYEGLRPEQLTAAAISCGFRRMCLVAVTPGKVVCE